MAEIQKGTRMKVKLNLPSSAGLNLLNKDQINEFKKCHIETSLNSAFREFKHYTGLNPTEILLDGSIVEMLRSLQEKGWREEISLNGVCLKDSCKLEGDNAIIYAFEE